MFISYHHKMVKKWYNYVLTVVCINIFLQNMYTALERVAYKIFIKNELNPWRSLGTIYLLANLQAY